MEDFEKRESTYARGPSLGWARSFGSLINIINSMTPQINTKGGASPKHQKEVKRSKTNAAWRKPTSDDFSMSKMKVMNTILNAKKKYLQDKAAENSSGLLKREIRNKSFS